MGNKSITKWVPDGTGWLVTKSPPMGGLLPPNTVGNTVSNKTGNSEAWE